MRNEEKKKSHFEIHSIFLHNSAAEMPFKISFAFLTKKEKEVNVALTRNKRRIKEIEN
jgi:hypothetical protein